MQEMRMVGRTQRVRKLREALSVCPMLYLNGYFSGGKTELVSQLLAAWNGEKRMLDLCREADFEALKTLSASPGRLIVLENVDRAANDGASERIEQLMTQTAQGGCLVMTGRAPQPAFLRIPCATGRVTAMGQDFLAFDRDEARQLLMDRGVEADSATLDWIMHNTEGWPLALMLYALVATRYPELPMTEQYSRIGEAVRDCLDREVYQHLMLEDQQLLRSMALFDDFSGAMARRVSGMRDASERLHLLAGRGGYVVQVREDTFRMKMPMRRLMEHKLHAVEDEESVRALCGAAAAWYEEKGAVKEALRWWKQAGDLASVARILTAVSAQRPGSHAYAELVDYYLLLPREQVMTSIPLMQGLSILYSILMQPEESEQYYQALEDYAAGLSPRTDEYREAQSMLAYLRIALPHRGAGGMVMLLRSTAQLMSRTGWRINDMNASGFGPSLLNGGKDFCSWLPHARTLHRLLKKPVEQALGASGAGLASTALGEALFETSVTGEYGESIELLTDGKEEAERRSEIAMQFAAVGALCRVFAAEGSIEAAQRWIGTLEERLNADAPEMLRRNVRVSQVHLAMLRGDSLTVTQWMKQDAPDERLRLMTSDRYSLLLKARIYVVQGRWAEARALLAQLMRYFKTYSRPYGIVQTELLQAVIARRSGQGDCLAHMQAALEIARRYGLVRVIADEGMAVLDILADCIQPDTPYHSALLTFTRRQAAHYPLFMQSDAPSHELLTQTEQEIYQLIVAGKSNEVISRIMGVTLRTVKFHSANIYRKLGVKNRTEAILKAVETEAL